MPVRRRLELGITGGAWEPDMKDGWLHRATERNVIVRATLTCVIVGAVLVAINHGDAIARGDLDPGRLVRIALTFLVPFMVSVVSSASALGHERRRRLPPAVTVGDDGS